MINMRLSQVKDKTNNDIAIFDSLALAIIIRDFYQFLSRVGRLLWTHLVTTTEIHDKGIWNHCISVITLTEQI